MNYTTYIRKNNWERFKDEPQKAELINSLLDQHYSTHTFTSKDVKKDDWTISTPPKTKTSSLRSDVKLCKIHYLPLTEFGKCLQKGCKYA